MKFFVSSKISLVLFGFVTAIVVGSGSANADFTFGTPTNLGPTVNSSDGDFDVGISADGLFLYFGSFRPGGYGDADIWVATRPTQNDLWDTPVNLGPTVNSPYIDSDPSLSTDGLSLFFRSHRPGGSGAGDLYVTTRATTDNPWREPVNLGPIVNSEGSDSDPCISADGLYLYFSTFIEPRPGGLGGDDIWVTTRPSTSDPWGEPINLGPPINTPYDDLQPSITADRLTLFFDTYMHPGGYGYDDIWVTTRATTDDLWGEPVNLGPPVNTAAGDADPELSADGLELFFNSDRPGGVGAMDLWQVSIEPVVDLNGDGIVDASDICIMVDYWGEYYPLCDIGPTPLGDGIVDVEDLIVLAGHLFEDYRLIAHWKMDEMEGDKAYDSVDVNDGVLNGVPIWQPDGGIVAGALQFDGIDDYVETDFVLNQANGTFSVFAWIKGGAPGEAIISQADIYITIPVQIMTDPGSVWLGADPNNGRLMTGFVDTIFGSLESDSIITDGQWHHIGLVFDHIAMKRHLYLDGTEVAVDAGLVGGLHTTGALYIGTGPARDANTFFSGLIDDVRIYDAALTPEQIAKLAQ